MTEFRCFDLNLFPGLKRRHDTLMQMAESSGIDIRIPDVFRQNAVAIYSYAPKLDVDRLIDQMSFCDKFARTKYDCQPIHFYDFNHGTDNFEKLTQFAKDGSLKAAVFKDVNTFVFAKENKISQFLVPLRDTGIAIHFAAGFYEPLSGSKMTTLTRTEGARQSVTESRAP